MAFTTLTKTTAQQTPYSYTWSSDASGVTVTKYMGTTTIQFCGTDDADAVAKINAYELMLDARGDAIHG